jgi:hypothetical protein
MSSSTEDIEVQKAHKLLYERGLEMRKLVLGDEYVQKSLENANKGSGFGTCLQEYATVSLVSCP